MAADLRMTVRSNFSFSWHVSSFCVSSRGRMEANDIDQSQKTASHDDADNENEIERPFDLDR